MIGDRRTWIVDWPSWPTVGAAFIDPACLVVQLIAAGHTAEQAEARAAECKGWANANPGAEVQTGTRDGPEVLGKP
jgi:hypothetical protein